MQVQLELFHYALGFGGAAVAGFIDAIIGGGGLITTPLILSLGIPVQQALATSKLQSTMGALMAVFSLRKAIPWRALIWPAALVFAAACVGAHALLSMSNEALKPLIFGLLSAVFAYTIFKPNLGNESAKKRLAPVIFFAIFGAALGFYDGFLGPGTGSFWIFSLVLLQGLNMREASVQTKLLNAASNVAALVYFVSFFEVFWALGLAMGAGSMLGNKLGSAYLLRANLKFIKILFTIIVAASLVKMGFSFF